MTRDNPETNPITIIPDTASHMAEQFSWVPLPCCSLPGCPFPIKSLALSARVSPRTIHFLVLDKSPLSGPGRGPLPATYAHIISFLELLTILLSHRQKQNVCYISTCKAAFSFLLLLLSFSNNNNLKEKKKKSLKTKGKMVQEDTASV